MPYEIRLTGSRKSPSVTKKLANPFTRENMILEPWFANDDDTRRAREVLDRAGAEEVAERKHLLALADRSAVLVTRAGPVEGNEHDWRVKFPSPLQALSDDAFVFLFELCAAGSFVIDGDDVAIAAAPSVKERFADVVVVSSPADLCVLMKLGLEAWNASREDPLP